MPEVELYCIPASPPSRMVEMVANLAGVTLKKHPVNLSAGEHLKEDFLKLNPLHKVPVMVDGDLKLSESRAIAAYLINKYMPQDDTLYPKDPVKRAKVDELLYIDCGTLWPAGLNLLREKIYRRVDKLDQTAEKNYREVLGYIDGRVKDSGFKYILGDEFTLADISLAATFSFPVFCGYSISDFKNLTAYLDRLASAIPKYREINEEAIANMTKFIEAKQQV